MMRLTWICLLFALAAGAPGATAQQSSSGLILFGALNGHAPVSTTTVPAQIAGHLTVSFHGDPSTGCAAQGTCGYSGTVVFRPGPPGALGLSKYRLHGRTSYQLQLSLPGGSGAPFTAARVMRAGGGACSDARQPNVALDGTVTGGEAALGLLQPQGNVLTTRCAGPLDGDLAGLGPQIRLTVGQLLRGRRTVGLSGTWSFAAAGFAGSIDSNLTMVLGKPGTQRPGTSSSVSKVFRHDREVTETLTLTRGTGSLSLALAGDPSSCQFLDSCGIRGTLSGTFAAPATTATLLVIGPASRPYADFRAALGLTRQGNPRGLQVNGALAWQSGGSLTEQLQQGLSCSSSAPLPGGYVIFGTQGRRLTATYYSPAPPRTRCPGPELPQFQSLASGGLGLAEVGRPSFTLRLSGSGPLADDGYTIRQRTGLTLTLRRGQVHQRTFAVLGP